MTRTVSVQDIRRKMSPTMERALVDFAGGVTLHGRELSSLIVRRLVEPHGRCLTTFGAEVANEIIQEKK